MYSISATNPHGLGTSMLPHNKKKAISPTPKETGWRMTGHIAPLSLEVTGAIECTVNMLCEYKLQKLQNEKVVSILICSKFPQKFINY